MALMNVSALGSCRVHYPLSVLAKKNRISVGHVGAEWYVHSTCDILQKIAIVRNELVLSDDCVNLIVEGRERKWHPELHRPGFYDDADVFVVEVSSRKLAYANGLYFQQWLIQDLEQNLKSKEIDMRHVSCRRQSPEEITSGLFDICKSLGRPVIFVGHFNVPLPNGEYSGDRAVINDCIEEFV